jgi:Ca2+/Na+ antiporter
MSSIMDVFKERQLQCKRERIAYNKWFVFLNRIEGGLFVLIIVLAVFCLFLIYKNPAVLERTETFGVLLCIVPVVIAFAVYAIREMEISQNECSRMVDEYTVLEKEYACAQRLAPAELSNKFNELEERLSIVKFWSPLRPPSWLMPSEADNSAKLYLPAVS